MIAARSSSGSAGVELARRPALFAAALLAAGIAAHSLLPVAPLIWLILLTMLIVVATISHRAMISSLCISLAIMIAGVAAAQIASTAFPGNHIGLFTSDEPCLASLELKITDTPRLIPSEGPRPGSGRQFAHATVTSAKTWRGWEPVSGEITFSLAQMEPRLVAGQHIRAVGTLERPAPPQNPGQFDWEDYYRRQRVLAEMHVNRTCDLTIVNGSSEAPLTHVRERAREWLRAGFPAQQKVDRELLVALIFGDRDPAMRKVEDDCNATGASHLLASSGLRIGMLMGLVFFLCRLLRLRPQLTLLLITSAVILLSLVMVPNAQALRPILACCAVGIGLCLRRSIDSIQLLGLAALALLVYRPLDFYSAGFQLTFVVVLGLLVLTPPFYRIARQRFSDPDMEVLLQIGRLSLRQRCWRWLRNRVIELAVAGIVAWAVSLPLVAYHFEQINLWSVPVDLVLLPVTLAALILGFIKIVFTAVLPFTAPMWAAIAEVPLWILRHGASWATHLPGADIPITRPPLWWILLFYLLLIAFCAVMLAPQTRARVRVATRFGLAGAWGMSLLLPMRVGFSPQGGAGDELRIIVLSVGAGQCIAVEPPGGGIVFIDAGSSTLSDPLRTVIAPFLRHEGRSSVDEIFLSHGDFDHISAAEGIMASYHPRELITSPGMPRHADASSTCRRLLTALHQSHHDPRLAAMNDEFDFGGGARAQIIWPPPKSSMDSNNAALVLRVTFGGRSILFPADIQAPAEAELLEHPEKLQSDILIAPHHGSAEFTTKAFVAAVNPKVIISSNAHRLTSKQRSFEQTIDARRLYRTGQCGAVTVTIARNGSIKVQPFMPRRAAEFESDN